MSTSLREIISALLESMDQRKELKSLDPSTQEMLDKALDRVVDGTDSKISLVPGYKRKLSKSIIKSLQYADNMIEQIPHPIELGSDQLVSNPYIHAFFYTITGLKKACNQSSELREFFQEPEHSRSSESCAMLCMRKVEETVLGMQLEGDQLIKDVKQTRVTFVSHRIQSPAEKESVARKELKCCIFEGLINNALENILALRNRRRELETEQRVLSSRLRSHRSGTINEGNSSSSVEDELKLEQIEQELNNIGYVTPEVSLDQVNTTFDHPEDFVSMKKISINLDKSGILRSSDEHSPSISKLNLSEVTIKGQLPRVVQLVRIKRDELVSPEITFPHII